MKRLIILLLLIPALCSAGMMDKHKSIIAQKRIAGGGSGEIGSIANSTLSFTIATGNTLQSKYQPTTAGAINYGHVKLSNTNGANICLSIYNSSGVKLASGSALSATDTATYFNILLDSEIILVDSIFYYITVSADADMTTWTNTAVSNQWQEVISYLCGQPITVESGSLLPRQPTMIFNDDPGAP